MGFWIFKKKPKPVSPEPSDHDIARLDEPWALPTEDPKKDEPVLSPGFDLPPIEHEEPGAAEPKPVLPQGELFQSAKPAAPAPKKVARTAKKAVKLPAKKAVKKTKSVASKTKKRVVKKKR